MGREENPLAPFKKWGIAKGHSERSEESILNNFEFWIMNFEWKEKNYQLPRLLSRG
jgi:hypothetical protein